MTSIDIPFRLASVNPINEYTEVRTSKTHGLGLFSKKIIPKGIILWHARSQDILIISKEQFLILDSSFKSLELNEIIENILTYSFYVVKIDALVFCLDNSRFVNHSLDPNLGAPKDENEFCAVTLRDINPREEITEDYSEYPTCFWLKKYRGLFDYCCW